MYKSTHIKAQQVQELVARHYEAGRQDRCKLWVYRNVIYPRFGISERTFFRLLATPEREPEDQRQLTLDF